MKSVVIAGYARSPFTLSKKGDLARVRPDDIAAQVVRALVDRTGVAEDDIEDLILGCAASAVRRCMPSTSPPARFNSAPAKCLSAPVWRA
jgi:acetyl-CoA acetyltransferase